VKFSFEPGDIVSRVMSFGSPTPVEVAVSGPNLAANLEHAQKIREQLQKLPALRDIQFGQTLDYPTVDVALNRERAGQLGVKTVDVSRSLVEATASSRFTVPNYWADPVTGVSYLLQVQVPQAGMNSVEQVKNVPVRARDGGSVLLRNVAEVTENTAVGQYERYNSQRMVTVAVLLSVGPHVLVARTQKLFVDVSTGVISIDGKLKYSSEPRIEAMACSSVRPSSELTSPVAPLRYRSGESRSVETSALPAWPIPAARRSNRRPAAATPGASTCRARCSAPTRSTSRSPASRPRCCTCCAGPVLWRHRRC